MDALCILQPDTSIHDDKHEGQVAARADWDNESQGLWQTFQGAHITICAASSTSCQDSFLQDRPRQPHLVLKVRIPDADETTWSDEYRWADGNPWATNSTLATPYGPPTGTCELTPWRIRNPLGELYKSSYPCPFLADVTLSRWYNRGWVHQEISMSKRLLIFDTNILYMRCGGLQACENGWHSSQTHPHLDELDHKALVGSRRGPFSVFARHVEKYFEKQLTVETDRLQALAALASQVQRSTGSQYIAGLWRDNLGNDLLYTVCSGEAYNLCKTLQPWGERIHALNIPESGARPSWSWAGHQASSQNHGLDYNWQLESFINTGYILECDLVDPHTEPACVGGNPFGAVRCAHLTLQCRVVGLQDLFAAGIEAKPPSSFTMEWDYCELPGMFFHWDTDDIDIPDSLIEDISLIYTSRRPDRQLWYNCYLIAGLIVYPTSKDRKSYYRIGIWKGKSNICIDNHSVWKSQEIILV